MKQLTRLLTLILLLAACAPTLNVPQGSQQEVLQEHAVQRQLSEQAVAAKQRSINEQQARLYDITTQLLYAARGFCPKNITYEYGAMTATPRNKKGEPVNIRMPNGAEIAFVAHGFGAHQAGLRVGDSITAINGRNLKGLMHKDIQTILAQETQSGRNAALTYIRNGEMRQANVGSSPACNYQPVIQESKELNAYADGKRVVVTTTMLDFAGHDDELALVMGHEIAHNLLGHVSKKQGQAMLGSLADAALGIFGGINTGGMLGQAGGMVYSQAYESESDYLGLYLMARAGFGLEKAAPFWRRMAAKDPRSLEGGGFGASHPSSPERFVTLENTRKEIEAKRARNEELLPNMRVDG